MNATDQVTARPILYAVIGSVALITLNRPHRLNAWSLELDVEYTLALSRAASDPAVRAIVITGAGRAFSAGADLDALRDMPDGGARVTQASSAALMPELTIRKPIIAAINGACVGLAFVHAMSCDVRFIAESAKVSTAFVRRGLVAEHGISWLLTRSIGLPGALDLLLSGRTFSGADAAQLGLVVRAVPAESVMDVAMEYARDLAVNCSPASMQLIKGQVLDDLERSLVAATKAADELMAESFRRDDFREGVLSFIEKRPPMFAPLVDHAG